MQQSSPAVIKGEPNNLDASPVFFTGLSRKAAITNLDTKLCRLCKRRSYGIYKEGICPNCSNVSREVPNYSTMKQNCSSANISPSCSNNIDTSNELKNDVKNVLSSPVMQNDLINSSIQTLLHTDIKALLNSVQTPKRETDNLKAKSNYRNRHAARSRTTPYSHTPVTPCNSNHAPGLPYPSPPMPPYCPLPLLPMPSPKWGPPSTNQGQYAELSRQMWEVFHKNKQTAEVKSQKMQLREALHNLLVAQYIRFDSALYIVGSSMTGLGTKNSDIDMCLMLSEGEINQKTEALKILKNIRTILFRCKFVRGVRLIPAKVPILRFFDKVSGVEVDLNINNSIGIRNTQLLTSYARIDPRVAPMVVLVKIWAKHYDINDASRNTLSSYSIVLMVIHYLQYRCQPPVIPCLQMIQKDKYLLSTKIKHLQLYEDLPNFVSENKEDLGELFMGFLNYYANEFDFSSVISVRLGQVIPKDAIQCSPNNIAAYKFVSIEEPFDFSNTARSVFAENIFKQICATFQNSWLCMYENPSLDYLLS